MSVVVSETDATKPRKARVKDGVVVAMGDPAADAGHSARVFRGDVVSRGGLLRAPARPAFTCRLSSGSAPPRALSGPRYRTVP